jgi:hypothetical protein
MDEALDILISHCGFKTVCVIKFCSILRVAEENCLNLMINVCNLHSLYHGFFSKQFRSDSHTILCIKKFMSIILYVTNKLHVILGVDLLEKKSIPDFWVLKRETQAEIRKQAAKVVSVLKRKEVSF